MFNLIKEVPVNCIYASLLRARIHMPRQVPQHPLSHKMNNERADGHCYRFKDLGRSMTHVFLLMDHFFIDFLLLTKN